MLALAVVGLARPGPRHEAHEQLAAAMYQSGEQRRGADESKDAEIAGE
ncbi:hypothetical protein [Demequina activiva]|nr:hypothetical protein [Demequina activiva]